MLERFLVPVLIITLSFALHADELVDEIQIKHQLTGKDVKDLSDFQETKDSLCPVGEDCWRLDYPCINCSMNETCVYGGSTLANCKALVECNGSPTFSRLTTCQYCYQSAEWEHECVLKAHCNSVPRSYYRTNCTVFPHVVCLGHRTFLRKILCNWTGGHRWSVALILSLTLGGFGADRFYLGYWQEGVGKLFSFGGLGVWTIIDFILIAIQYLGPADGSLYL